MWKFVLAVGVSGLLLALYGYRPSHHHGKPASAAVVIDRELVPRIDRDQLLPDVEAVLDLAVKGELCGKSILPHRSAFVQAMRKEAINSRKTEFLFVLPYRDCNYDFETLGADGKKYCEVAWLRVVVCRKCDIVTTAALFHMQLFG